MIEFKLPSLGADMDDGTLLRWHVKAGDSVKRGQVVAVVDTSKAAVDVEIWNDGVVAELRVQPGEKIPVGTVLATLRVAGETAVTPAPLVADSEAKRPPEAPLPATAATPATTQVQPTPPVKAAFAVKGNGSSRSVSPAARQRASALGIDPQTVTGTGVGASVTLADIEAAASGAIAVHPTTPATEGNEPPAAPDRQKEMRKAIAAAMSRSKREIPHYYLAETIPLAIALEWLAQRNQDLPITARVLPAVLLLKAAALALARVPELNGFYRNGVFEAASGVHPGVAISLRGGGLVAPAIHDVNTKSLEQLMRELSDLVKRARAGSLRSSELSDPTITVTNLGEQSVQSLFGVIYPPQVALVGFGSVAVRPWVQGGKLCALPTVNATLSGDHRVSDGHRGALFLAELRELLQQPQSLAGASPPPARHPGDPP